MLRDILRTVDGRLIRVLHPGTPNDGDGPDFLDAALALDDAPIRGDVEFHFRTEDWYAHGHHRDARYGRVVLHVVLEHSLPGFYVRGTNSAPVPILELRACLRIPLGRLAPELSRLVTKDGCPLPEGVPTIAERDALLNDLSETRLLRKADRFRDRAAVVGADGAFYELLADALGYSQNRLAFAKLVERAPLQALETRTPVEIEAVLFGTAGLLPSQRQGSPDADYVDALESAWARLPWKPEPMRAEEWRAFPVRRGNAPARRVAALAKLVAETGGRFLDRAILRAQEGEIARWRPRWRMFQVSGNGYWAEHDDFGVASSGARRHLVGESRSRDIWVNVALPALLVHAERTSDDAFRARVVRLYRSHPALQPNLKTRWVSENVLSRSERRDSAVLQQGMLELYDRYCEPRRCAMCPLASRVNRC